MSGREKTKHAQEKKRLIAMLKALSNPVRLQIVEYLAGHPTCITNDIVKVIPLAQSTVSQHLKVLREAGLIQGEIEGPATCYCLDPEGFSWLNRQFSQWMADYDPGVCRAEPEYIEHATREISMQIPQNLDDNTAQMNLSPGQAEKEYIPESAVDAILAKAYLHPDMAIAVVGAGSIHLAKTLAGIVRKVIVTGADVDPLERARSGPGLSSNIEYLGFRGPSFPLPEATLDAVFYCMPHVAFCKVESVFRETIRVLVPGGRLVVIASEKQPEPAAGSAQRELPELLHRAGLVNLVFTKITAHPFAVDETSVSLNDFSLLLASGTKRIIARDQVRSTYAGKAQRSSCCGESSCCAPGTASLDDIAQVTWDGGYGTDDRSAIPAEAADFSLGCGNPIAMAGLKPGETVLDIGSGGGLDAFLAAAKVGEEGMVFGIDMTPAMLQRARATAVKHGYRNVKFRFGYAEKLPVDDGSIDVVISNCVINLTEDKGKVFDEAFRVLKPGGRLEVNDMVFGGPVLPAMRYSSTGWSECISGALPEPEYVDLVRQAGFTEIAIRRSTSHGVSGNIPVYSVQVSAKKS